MQPISWRRGGFSTFVSLWVVLSSAVAFADTPGQSRDDAIFGSPSSAPEKKQEKDTPAPTTQEDLDSVIGKLKHLDKSLTIGGLLYQQVDYLWMKDVPAAISEYVPSVVYPALLDVYLDARPTDRLRAFVRGRLVLSGISSKASGSGDSTMSTDSLSSDGVSDIIATMLVEMWLKFDILHTVYVTFGLQPIRWGSGHFWNPTDFMQPEIRNPVAIFDARTGVYLLKLQVPIESLGWSIYGVLNFNDVMRPKDWWGALRAETLWGQATEVSLTAAYAPLAGQHWRMGIDISTGIWLFDVHAEAAFSEDGHGGWSPEVATGVDITFRYTDNNTATVGVEYFFNDSGSNDINNYPSKTLPTLYMGRHYVASFITLPGSGVLQDTTWTWNWIVNVGVFTNLMRFDFQWRVLRYLQFNLFAQVHFGKDVELMSFSTRINNTPYTIQGVLDTGVALRLNF